MQWYKMGDSDIFPFDQPIESAFLALSNHRRYHKDNINNMMIEFL